MAVFAHCDKDLNNAELSDWEQVELPIEGNPIDLYLDPSTNRLYVGFESGEICVSDDMGKTWTKVETGPVTFKYWNDANQRLVQELAFKKGLLADSETDFQRPIQPENELSKYYENRSSLV